MTNKIDLYDISLKLDAYTSAYASQMSEQDYLVLIRASTVLYKLGRMAKSPPVGANKEVQQ